MGTPPRWYAGPGAMKIVIETVAHKDQRYPTLGDWYRDKDGVLQIKVSAFSDPFHSFLVALHELIEVTLCDQRGITEEEVTAFDKAHLSDDDLWVNDPGLCPDAPYHREHVFAECIERLVAQELGVNWQDYELACLAMDAA